MIYQGKSSGYKNLVDYQLVLDKGKFYCCNEFDEKLAFSTCPPTQHLSFFSH